MNQFLKNETYAVTYGTYGKTAPQEQKLYGDDLSAVFKQVAKKKGFVIKSTTACDTVAEIEFLENIPFATMQEVLDEVQSAIQKPVCISSDRTTLGKRILEISNNEMANAVFKESILRSALLRN